MSDQVKAVLALRDEGRSYSSISKELSIPKPTVAVIIQSELIRNGEYLGHIDADYVKRRYLDEGAEVRLLAQEVGLSVAQLKLYTRAMRMLRDPGAVFRDGGKPKPGKGVRVPGSKRDLAEKAADFMSEEHREKLAAAKRGRKRELSNRWKGGRLRGGYLIIGGGSSRRYRHRELAVELIGRELETTEHVHHIDQNRLNNDPSNLLVMDVLIHVRLHTAMRKVPNLDQRKWLLENNHEFIDLVMYAKDSIQKAS